MDIKKISFVSLKIIAVWIFINSFIPNFISLILSLIKPFNEKLVSNSMTYIFGIVQAAIYLFVALTLWLSAAKISYLVTHNFEIKENSNDDQNKLQVDKILNLGIVFIGLYVLIIQIPNLLNYIVAFFEFSDFSIHLIASRYLASAIQAIISLLIAFYFIFSGEKISKLILKIRKL